MKHQSVLVLFLLTLISCNSDNKNDIDCQLFDPAFETILIEFIDAEGVNLIANNRFEAENIRLLHEGRSIGSVHDNLLIFETIGNQETSFTILLNNSTTDTLILDVTRSEGLCDIIFYTAESAQYNTNNITLEEVNNYTKSITVIK